MVTLFLIVLMAKNGKITSKCSSKKIGGDINNTMKKSDTPINKTLKEKFTMGELKQTIKGLRGHQ